MCKVVIKANRSFYLGTVANYLRREGCAYLIVNKDTRVVGAVGCVYADYGSEYEVVKAEEVTEIVIPIQAVSDWDNFRDDDDDDEDDFDEDEDE